MGRLLGSSQECWPPTRLACHRHAHDMVSRHTCSCCVAPAAGGMLLVVLGAAGAGSSAPRSSPDVSPSYERSTTSAQPSLTDGDELRTGSPSRRSGIMRNGRPAPWAGCWAAHRSAGHSPGWHGTGHASDMVNRRTRSLSPSAEEEEAVHSGPLAMWAGLAGTWHACPGTCQRRGQKFTCLPLPAAALLGLSMGAGRAVAVLPRMLAAPCITMRVRMESNCDLQRLREAPEDASLAPGGSSAVLQRLSMDNFVR